jgi:hypothetical protein
VPTLEPTRHLAREFGGSNAASETSDAFEEPVSTLRGAGVDVDVRRVGGLLGRLCLAGVAVSAVIFFWSGAEKNSQITRLQHQGIPVEATVTGCLGLLGGSGSNPVGYQCRGNITLDGRNHDEVIPGDSLYRPGTTLQLITVEGDPALLATPGSLANEHASMSVFIVPTILLLITGAGALLLLQKRRLRST